MRSIILRKGRNLVLNAHGMHDMPRTRGRVQQCLGMMVMCEGMTSGIRTVHRRV